uniref:Uncharacterized protein n=1 Tax=Romanomermis culicivorax TaxID=13658 RepID=A0A915IPK9_ROMCU
MRGRKPDYSREMKVFNTLYKLDKNAIPPCFELQNFRSKKSISESDMKALMALFSKYDNDNQPDKSGHLLFHRPCLEQMISKAVLDDGKNRNSDLGTSLFYLKNYSDDGDFQMNELHEKLLSCLEKSNLIQFQSESKTQHQAQNSALKKQSNDSISYFAQELTYKMKQLIDRTYANGYDWSSLQNQPNVEYFFCTRVEIGQLFEQIRFHFDLLYPFANALQQPKSFSNVQLHSSAVSEKCNVTWDKSECLRSISKWFSGALVAPSCPIIIQGDEGSGKSTILRRVSTFAPKWLNSEVTIVSRFINSCSSSKYAHELLRGVCIQICLTYELYPLMKYFGTAFTTDKVFRFFDQVCARASEKAAEQRRPLIILLDDLNQLKYATYASGRTFNFCPWVPRELPMNVIFVATVTKSFLNLNMLPIKPDSSGRCHVPNISADDLFGIVKAHLSSNKRTLSSEQQQTVMKFLSFEPTPSPLLAKFLGRECATWHSNFSPPSQFLSTKMTTYFISVIEKLEKLYAHVVAPFESLIGAWCSYLECSRYGSLVDETYHRNISEMYRWSEYNNADEQDNVGGKVPLVARLSAPQYFHPSTGKIIYDRRAAHNFWYHVFQAGTVNDFEEQSLCNYSYLDSILNVTNLLHMLSIFEESLSQLLDHNLHILYGTVIRPSVDTLAYSTKYFAAELIGRLNFTRSRNTEILNNLLNQAMYWVDNVCVYPIIVPLTSWIRPPLCPLVTSLKILDYMPGMATIIQPTINYQHLLLAGYADGRILMYHILSNMVVKSFVGKCHIIYWSAESNKIMAHFESDENLIRHTDKVLCLQLSNNGLHFATGSNDGTFRLWNLQQGSCVKNFENGTDKTSCALFTKDNKFIFTGWSDSSIKMLAFETWSIHKTFVGHTGTVSALALTNENEYLVSAASVNL